MRSETHFSCWDKYERSPLLRGGRVGKQKRVSYTTQAAEPSIKFKTAKFRNTGINDFPN